MRVSPQSRPPAGRMSETAHVAELQSRVHRDEKEHRDWTNLQRLCGKTAKVVPGDLVVRPNRPYPRLPGITGLMWGGWGAAEVKLTEATRLDPEHDTRSEEVGRRSSAKKHL